MLSALFLQESSFLDGVMRAELRTKLVDDLLSVDDSMSMAHSLELRVPLLDNRIVDLLAPLPWQSKFLHGQGKVPLRRVVQSILPEESFLKPKWGFSVDVFSWYRGEFGELIRQVATSSDVLNQYFNKSVIHRIVNRAKTPNDRRYQVLLWQLLGFHLWHRIFIDSEHPEKVQLEMNALAA